MERMTRNGLLILIAVLTAFALPLCLINSARAQMTGPQIPGTYPPEYWRGFTAFIQYNPYDGTTTIVYPDPDPDNLDPDVGLWTHPYGWINTGIETNNINDPFSPVFAHYELNPFMSGWLYDLGIVHIYNVPDAFGNGGVIRSADDLYGYGFNGPAIVNGVNTSGTIMVPRYYQMVITGDEMTGYTITWYYIEANDPFQTLYPLDLAAGDDLPLEIQWWLAALAAGAPITDNGDGSITIDAGYVIPGITHIWNGGTGEWELVPQMFVPGVGMGYGPFNQLINIHEYNLLPYPPTPGFPWQYPMPPGTAGLTPNEFTGGWMQVGRMHINQRTPTGKRTFEGDKRTLIVAEGGMYGGAVAIENRGILEIYDSRIETRGPRIYGSQIGIMHGYMRTPVTLSTTAGTPPVTTYTHAGYSYPMGIEEGVFLFNTQIGRADGFSTDPITGQVDMSRVPFDDYRGSPMMTYTDLRPGDVITTDGVNGRIIVGQEVIMKRNPIGSIAQIPAYPERDYDARYTIYNLWELDAPDVGIYARPDLGEYDYMGRDYAYFINSNTLINMNYYFYSRWQPGYMSTIAGEYGTYLMGGTPYIEDQIQLNDNSWIFANLAGIAFGNTQGNWYIGDSAIRVAIDKSSGIFSAGIGITDRYSTTDIWVAVIPADNAANHKMIDSFYGYSGSMHEIHVGGKVITGAPSRAGIRFYFDDATLNNPSAPADTSGLSKVYYYDKNDPDADLWGRVFYTRETAYKFVAFNDQPNRMFWLELPGGQDPVQLTRYDYDAQRWMLNPDAPTVRVRGAYGNEPLPFFAAFDASFGIGIEVVGTSWMWEASRLAPAAQLAAASSPWSSYLGPTVREITILKDDALVTGGTLNVPMLFAWSAGYDPYNPRFSGLNDIFGMAMYFDISAHVAKILVGENKDVKNLSDVLFVGTPDTFYSPSVMTNFKQSVKNFQAFDMMTSTKRSKFLYNPNVLFSNDPDVFHFDNSGIHGDILSAYNGVAQTWSGGGGGFWNPDGTWEPGSYSTYGGGYASGVVGTTSYDGPSFLLGIRDQIRNGSGNWYWTDIANLDGRSLILDEILLNFLAGRAGAMSQSPELLVPRDFYGYADSPRHFREALARLIHYHPSEADFLTGLTVREMLEGYTRDGTLIVFSNGDIFSSNIYGGGYGDSLGHQRFYPVSNTGQVGSALQFNNVFGNIDLRFKDGTTIFNNNVVEYVNGSNLYHEAGIRVRDLYVESTGHLLLNDAQIAVNPFVELFSSDYAQRLIIHDVLNEGIISGNGVFQIGERLNDAFSAIGAFSYFEGYLINRGILAPGLPGFIGESEEQAWNLEKTSYQNMLKSVTNSSGTMMWENLMRGVPGGQFGAMTVFGSLRLMDEHIRPVYNPEDPLYNTMEMLKPGQYHVTVGNDSIADVFGKYAATIANSPSVIKPVQQLDGTVTYVYDESILQRPENEGKISKEDWQIIAVEKLGTHLSWFSPSAMVDSKTGLQLLTRYEQFEYITDPVRRSQLQRKMVEMVLTATELSQYDNNPAQRAVLQRKMLAENNIMFELTQQDHLLMRYGFSDVVSVHGTIPVYLYEHYGWSNLVYTHSKIPPAYLASSGLLGITQLGGIVQADRIFDLEDPEGTIKDKQTSFIIIASEAYTPDGTIKQVTSATTGWVFANVDVVPMRLASGQLPTVLTVIDDPNYYRNRVAKGGNSYNAKSVASALDDAMLTNPGLAMAFQFGLNSPEVLHDTLRQAANGTRANSVMMNLISPSDHLFNQIGYGTGGLSTGNRGNIVFRNMQTGQLQQPYGQPAVPPPGTQFAPPMAGQTRGQSPFHRTGSVWGAFTNSSFVMGDDDNSYKYTFYRNGGMIGTEWNLTPSSVLGGVFTFNDGNMRSLSNKVNSVDYTFGLYFVAAPFEQFELKSYFGGGYQSYKMDRYIRNRDIFIGNSLNNQSSPFGINDHYHGETRGHSFNYAIEFARPFTTSPNFVIRPAAGFEYQTIQQNAYSDRKNMSSSASWSVSNPSNIAGDTPITGPSSGTFAMDYEKMTLSRSFLRLGGTTESYFPRGGLRFRGYYVHRLTGDQYPVSEQTFTVGSKSFKVRGADLGTSYVQVGSGLHFWLNQDRTSNIFMNGDWNFSMKNRGYSMLSVNIGWQQSF
ncbi:MAG: autotransporter outer membrane beta-barrel domain-containing protein [Planctomycetaceae bacterium]|nr:autotransporter outer membrane beta-barrel domain-containing protein [Planctomycetaceae bacterium]